MREISRTRFSGIGSIALGLGISLVLLSCGGKVSESLRDRSLDPRPQDETGTIEGIPAERFYARFEYRQDVEGAAPFRYLSTPWLELEDSRFGLVYARFSLFLLPERQFALGYEESLGQLNGRELDSRTTLIKRVIRGTWKVRGTDLLLGDAAVGRGTRRSGQPAVNLVVLQDLHSGGSVGFADALFFAFHTEAMEARLLPHMDSEEATWFTGRWTLENPAFPEQEEKFEIRREPRQVIFERHRDVGKEPGSGVPPGTTCRFRTYASEADLSADVSEGRLRYRLSTTIDRVEAIEDSRNSPACVEYIERRQRTLLTRPWIEDVEFLRANPHRILTRDGRYYSRS